MSNAEKLRVFVTGSTGLVGSHAIQHLASSGHTIVALVRESGNTTRLDALKRTLGDRIQIVVSELHDCGRLSLLMRNCDAVVHAAACIDPHGDFERLHYVNVKGTDSVVRAAEQAGVRHLVHISSLSVIMGETDCFEVTEDTPLRECREAYANSKIAAERLVMSGSWKNIKVTALRPGFIYGPNEKSWLPHLIKRLRAGTAMLVGNGSKETNLIYVGNLCRAIELALLNPVAYGQVYNLTDGERVSKRELFDTVCDGLSLRPVEVSIPLFVARALVEISSVLARLSPPSLRRRLCAFSRPALRLVALNQGFNISKAQRELGYTAANSFREAMGITLQSFAKPSYEPVTTNHKFPLSAHAE